LQHILYVTTYTSPLLFNITDIYHAAERSCILPFYRILFSFNDSSRVERCSQMKK